MEGFSPSGRHILKRLQHVYRPSTQPLWRGSWEDGEPEAERRHREHVDLSRLKDGHVRTLTGFVRPCSRATAKVEVTHRDRQCNKQTIHT